MRVVGFTEPGGPEVLGIHEVADPHPGPGQVRIRVHAAAVSPTDGLMRRGLSDLSRLRPPYVPGMDAAGVVDEVGAGSRWQVGDAVMTSALPTGENGGAYCEYLIAADDAPARVPAGVSFEAAATISMNGLTALQALERLALAPGQVLAITGAAGILGNYAIQLAKRAGLVVVADAAPKDAELVRSLGADVVVARGSDVADRIRQEFPDGVDGLLDAALLLEGVIPAVRDEGAFAYVRAWNPPAVRGIRFTRVLVTQEYPAGRQLDGLRQAVEDGVLTPRLAGVFPADQAAEAHRLMEGGGVRGRYVLTF